MSHDTDFGGSLSDAEIKKLAAKLDEATLLHFGNDGRAIARRNGWRALLAKGKPTAYVTSRAVVATRDSDTQVQKHAATLLSAAHADHMTGAVMALVELTADNALADVANASIDKLGKAALSTLLTQLDARDGDKADRIIDAVLRFGQTAGTGLKPLASDPNAVVRTLARIALYEIGGKALTGSAAAMVDGLKDPWDQGRAAAVRTMGVLCPKHVKDPDSVVDILSFLYEEDPHSVVRKAAEDALKAIG
ncbi:MAG: HEAT repeat domain-containing protein [Myxococcales bacterium]|nr:HEAT repeat domain-containing protein [Myxococcales bacterium]